MDSKINIKIKQPILLMRSFKALCKLDVKMSDMFTFMKEPFNECLMFFRNYPAWLFLDSSEGTVDHGLDMDRGGQ